MFSIHLTFQESDDLHLELEQDEVEKVKAPDDLSIDNKALEETVQIIVSYDDYPEKVRNFILGF